MNRKKATIIFVLSALLSVSFLVLTFLSTGFEHSKFANIISYILIGLWIVSIFVLIYTSLAFILAFTNETKNTEFVPEDMKDYSDLPEYKGSQTFFVNLPVKGIFLAILGIALASFFSLSTSDADVDGGLIVRLFVLTALYIYWLGKYLTRFMRIKAEGIYFYSLLNGPKQFFPWDKIKSIGISPAPAGPGTAGYLYISTRETNEIVKIKKYTNSKIRVMISFRPRAVHCILKYYKGHINYLGCNKAWQKYVLRLRNMPLDSYRRYDTKSEEKLKVKIVPAANAAPIAAALSAKPDSISAATTAKSAPKSAKLYVRSADDLTYSQKDVFFFSTPAHRWALAACTLFFVMGSIGIDAYSGQDALYAWVISAALLFALAKAHSRKMTVAKEGIFFKNYLRNKSYFFPWADIKSIGISKYYGDEPALSEFFYVSRDNIGDYVDISKYTENRDIFMIIFQPRAVQSIKQHYRKKMNNVDEHKKWIRYTRRHNKQ